MLAMSSVVGDGVARCAYFGEFLLPLARSRCHTGDTAQEPWRSIVVVNNVTMPPSRAGNATDAVQYRSD